MLLTRFLSMFIPLKTPESRRWCIMGTLTRNRLKLIGKHFYWLWLKSLPFDLHLDPLGQSLLLHALFYLMCRMMWVVRNYVWRPQFIKNIVFKTVYNIFLFYSFQVGLRIFTKLLVLLKILFYRCDEFF